MKRLLLLLAGFACLVACRTSVDLPPEPQVVVVQPTPIATAAPRVGGVLPTIAPVPATRNPQGLAPVKVATATANPTTLRIQAIGLDLPVAPGTLNAGRELAAPNDTLGVVWYSDGPRPGMNGNAVLTGHLDWQGKPGEFFRLKELTTGDIIQVTSSDGKQYLYTVQSSELYSAESAPVTDILGAKDHPLLTLITCEGTFDPVKHDFSQRRVIRAIWY